MSVVKMINDILVQDIGASYFIADVAQAKRDQLKVLCFLFKGWNAVRVVHFTISIGVREDYYEQTLLFLEINNTRVIIC